IEARFDNPTIHDHRLRKETTMLALAHRIAQRWNGMEIATHGKKHFVIHEVGSPAWADFEGAYARLLQLVSGLYDEATTVQPDLLQDTVQLFEDQINRVADLCERIIARSNTLTNAEAASYMNIVKALEQVGDEAKDMASQTSGARQLRAAHPAVKEGLSALRSGTPHAAMAFHKEKPTFAQDKDARRVLSALSDALNARQTLFHLTQRTQ
ncbi:MAG: hypothetical protein AABY13_00625, partial [Nanoarchaeota archaeon]